MQCVQLLDLVQDIQFVNAVDRKEIAGGFYNYAKVPLGKGLWIWAAAGFIHTPNSVSLKPAAAHTEPVAPFWSGEYARC